jgi:hypothetical protein
MFLHGTYINGVGQKSKTMQKCIINTPHSHNLYYVSFEDYVKLKKLVTICFINKNLLSSYIYIYHGSLFHFLKKVSHMFVRDISEANIFLLLL